ncbi:MAG: hypothetical protein PHQ05_02985 [Sterolibacterium sp.]|nr:hypothetical protein [Sterolibacterium sp.]
MISTNISVGHQLLVAMIANNEPEFTRILDAACLQIRGNRFDMDAEIDRVIDQVRKGEIALGLEYDLASWKMVRSEMKERLAAKKEALLAA